jgi:colanic acid biosynthesis protein WcaH
MNGNDKLTPEDFAQVIRHAPLVSIDLIVRNQKGQVLLGKRRNAPAEGFWFVPGGRIYKGEKLVDALTRVIHEELGVNVESHSASFFGLFDHIFEDNVFDDPSFGTHYIVLAHQLELDELPASLPTEEHDKYQWLSTMQIENSTDVHPHTKAYFR